MHHNEQCAKEGDPSPIPTPCWVFLGPCWLMLVNAGYMLPISTSESLPWPSGFPVPFIPSNVVVSILYLTSPPLKTRPIPVFRLLFHPSLLLLTLAPVLVPVSQPRTLYHGLLLRVMLGSMVQEHRPLSISTPLPSSNTRGSSPTFRVSHLSVASIVNGFIYSRPCTPGTSC